MAAITSAFISRPGELRKWAERTLIGVGSIGLFFLAAILYFGFIS